MIRQKKQPLQISVWMELLLVAAAGVMAGVEATHGQWIWAAIFGVAGVAFGISVAVRLATGDKHGEA